MCTGTADGEITLAHPGEQRAIQELRAGSVRCDRTIGPHLGVNLRTLRYSAEAGGDFGVAAWLACGVSETFPLMVSEHLTVVPGVIIP